jgi:hypothetical protein
MDIATAIHNLNPELEFGIDYIVEDISGTPTLKWLKEISGKPTDAEINSKITELQTAWDNQEYVRDRIENYPSIQDQLDMQYWDSVNGTTTWADKIAEIKSAHPKT